MTQHFILNIVTGKLATNMEGKDLGAKKEAREILENYEWQIRSHKVMPEYVVYTDLYTTLQVLYAQKKYGLVTALCNAAIENM